MIRTVIDVSQPPQSPFRAPSHSMRHVLVCLAVGFVAVGCADDATDAVTTTVPGATAPTTVAPTTTLMPPRLYDIVGTALGAGVFTQLAGMVVDAGLVDTLRSAGPFTVFAPTDAAFAGLPVDALHAVQGDPDLLATVLTYHVVAGALNLEDLEEGTLETVAGIDLAVTRDGDKVFINGNEIVAGDIEATNGVIHVMDTVLLPPS
jgi:uncharacterized surface protein with fasciclin (FAS1) repeats